MISIKLKIQNLFLTLSVLCLYSPVSGQSSKSDMLKEHLVKSNSTWEAIIKVQLNSFVNISPEADYSDFTAKTISVNSNSNVFINLKSNVSFNEFWKIWIDFNNDGIFEDPDEMVFQAKGMGEIKSEFKVPKCENGKYKIRIAMSRDSYPAAEGALSQKGEVEDYTINVISNRPADLVVYPNPAKETLHIVLPNENSNASLNLKIYNNNGILIKEENINPNFKGYH